MSRFVDRLKLASQGVAQPMGFGRGRTVAPKPGILLVACLSQAAVSNSADLVSGADAGLIEVSGLENNGEALRGCAEAVPDIPWGAWLRGNRWQRNRKIKNLGGDFIIFPAVSTPLGVPENTGAGKIVEVEATLSSGILRTIDELPVDGVLLAVEYRGGASITWQQLMLFQRLGGLTTKPLLVAVPARVTAVELKLLWEAGVDGVVITVGAGQDGGLWGLREVVSKLSFPSSRRRGRVKARIPQISASVDVEGQEELPSDL